MQIVLTNPVSPSRTVQFMLPLADDDYLGYGYLVKVRRGKYCIPKPLHPCAFDTGQYEYIEICQCEYNTNTFIFFFQIQDWQEQVVFPEAQILSNKKTK